MQVKPLIHHFNCLKIEDDNKVSVNVTFSEELVLEEEIPKIFAQFNQPQIAIWLMSRAGFRESWAQFLCHKIINPIRSSCDKPYFYLCDFRNWQYLKKPALLHQPQNSKVVKKIESLKCQDISLLFSQAYFKFMKEDKSLDKIDYVNEIIWKRDVIWKKSEGFAASQVALSSLGDDYLYLETIKDKDVSLSYSALQYFEACYFIDQMTIKMNPDQNTIIFFLPNNECDYYKFEENILEQDVKEYLKNSDYFKTHEKLNIHFIPFKWGTEMSDRPYIGGGASANPSTFDSLKV
ncbi:MAG: hypothetical protein Tsb0021_08810 [Chlamydiales bacterium]